MIPRYGPRLDRALARAEVNILANSWEPAAGLEEALAGMERGGELDLGYATVRRTTGKTGRFKLKVPGEKVRTVTGAKATARVIVSKLTEVGDG